QKLFAVLANPQPLIPTGLAPSVRIPILSPVNRLPRWDRRNRIAGIREVVRPRRDREDDQRHRKNQPEGKSEVWFWCHLSPLGARSMSLWRTLERGDRARW